MTMTVAQFQKLRTQKGLTQAELAFLLGVKRDTVGQYERGSRRITAQIAEQMGRLDELIAQMNAAEGTPGDRRSAFEKVQDDIRDCKEQLSKIIERMDLLEANCIF